MDDGCFRQFINPNCPPKSITTKEATSLWSTLKSGKSRLEPVYAYEASLVCE